jgi:hypothetical protein
VQGVLSKLVTDETKRRRPASRVTTSIPLTTSWMTFGLLELPQEIDRSYEIYEYRCLRLPKVFGLDRTKVSHVKHFDTIDAAGEEPRLVGFRQGLREAQGGKE